MECTYSGLPVLALAMEMGHQSSYVAGSRSTGIKVSYFAWRPLFEYMYVVRTQDVGIPKKGEKMTRATDE